MNEFWHALWLCMVVIPVTIMWAACVFDIVLRRRELLWWKRLGWLVFVLVLPVIGALIYTAVSAGGNAELDFRDLEQLHSEGALTDVEYEQQRDRMYSQSRY